MQVNLDLRLFAEIATFLTITAGAVWWSFRRVNDIEKIPLLWKVVMGDDEEREDSQKKLGLVGRMSQNEDATEAVAGAHSKFAKAMAKGMRLASISNEHEIVAGVRAAIGEPAPTEDTGPYPIVRVNAEKPPRQPTPWRGVKRDQRREDD